MNNARSEARARAKRNYKDTLFRLIFKERKALLSLYNAINDTNYDNPDDIEINTIEDVVYMGMKNDVSFLFDKTLSLYEHQSTYNPNMPLRGFLYFADLYRQLIKDNERIYSKYIVKIPAPRYIVFYNGDTKDMPERVKELYLSAAFDGPADSGEFEWTATMVNINPGMNPELLDRCETLGGYVTFVDKVRTYNKSMPLTDAVDQAVDECVEDGVLEEFFSKHRREVRNMVLTEFDEEKYIKMMREEERAEGHAAGLAEGREAGLAEGREAGLAEGREAGLAEGRLQTFLEILGDLGEIPPEIIERAKAVDADTLKQWSKLAARAESMQEFLTQV